MKYLRLDLVSLNNLAMGVIPQFMNGSVNSIVNSI